MISSINISRLRSIVIGAAAMVSLLFTAQVIAAPSVTSVTANSTSVGLYDKFELTFNVGTAATNLYWPYDTSPNPGVPAGVGVTVDGLFSNDNWQTTIVQPAFYYQDYDRGNYRMAESHKDWLYPKGSPCWKVRFAPTVVGVWKYKIRVTDASGTTTYDVSSNTFTCTQSGNRGFVRVSPNDCRYFETSDKSFLNLLGLDDNVAVTYDMDTIYANYRTNGINLVRPWWQASQGPVLFGLSGQGGVAGWRNVEITTEAARPGELFSGKITSDTQVSLATDVKPSTTYRFSAWVKTVNLTGTGDYGVYLQAFDCTQADVPLTTKIKGTTDWTQLSSTITTRPGEYSIDFLKIVAAGMTSGTAYYTDLSLKEDLGGGNYGPELLSWTNFNAYKSVSQYEAWKADYQVECARQNGVYLKICMEEKADSIYGRIQADGTPGAQNDNNVYASPTHACRTYQTYFWRYMIARYGFATSIHSWEFCNEGDPFNTLHYEATQALASYVQANDPNHHLVTTSLWHSYPSKEFWGNPSYQAPGYSDWHQYVGLQNGSDLLQYMYGWQRASVGSGDSGYYHFVMDNTVYHSAPNSFYINNPTGYDARSESYPFAISPGHRYTISWYIKGRNLTATGTMAGSAGWVYPTLIINFRDGWWANDISQLYPGEAGDCMGTFDWTQKTYSFTAPANARYMILYCSAHWAVGECWYDDIRLHDDTSGEDIEVPNGNFDANRLDFDSALMTYSIGTQVGVGDSRVVKKPVIRGENGISGDKTKGDTYQGLPYTGENQQLVDDTSGVWYRKYTWGQINPFGVIEMYWWRDNINKYGLLKYAKAYQAFMSGIPLSNGRYVNARAACSVPALRAWGQKDTAAGKAHLWIDNSYSTWKNTVDKVTVAPITGTVAVSGFTDGKYKAEWWDTTSGTITKTEDVTCSSGKITLQVQNLLSDVACKIYPASGGEIKVTVTSPPSLVVGQTCTISVDVTNTNTSDATNCLVSAQVPSNMDYIPGSAESCGGTYNSSTGMINWALSSLATQGKITKTFQGKVK